MYCKSNNQVWGQLYCNNFWETKEGQNGIKNIKYMNSLNPALNNNNNQGAKI